MVVGSKDSGWHARMQRTPPGNSQQHRDPFPLSEGSVRTQTEYPSVIEPHCTKEMDPCPDIDPTGG